MKSKTLIALPTLLALIGFFTLTVFSSTAYAQVKFTFNITNCDTSLGPCPGGAALHVPHSVGQSATDTVPIDTLNGTKDVNGGVLTFTSNPATSAWWDGSFNSQATFAGPPVAGDLFTITATSVNNAPLAGNTLMEGYFLPTGQSDGQKFRGQFSSPINITHIDRKLLAALGMGGTRTCGTGQLDDRWMLTYNSGDFYLTRSVSVTFTASSQPCPCVDAPSSTMVGWFPFDETNGSAGASANLATQNTGIWSTSPYTSPTPGPGMVAGALQFNGINQYVDSPSSIVTNFGPVHSGGPDSCGGNFSTCAGDFSIDVWMNISALPYGVATIVDKRSGSAPAINGYSFYLYHDRLGLQLADGQGSRGYTNYLSNPLPSDETTGWHHVAVTVQRASVTGITWYYDGYPIGNASNPTDRLGSLVNPSPLRIGANTTEPAFSNWFNGSLDELEIYNRALSATEVAVLYDADQAGKCKP